MTYLYTKLLIVFFVLRGLGSTVREGNLEDYPYLALIGTFTDQNYRFTSACTGSIITRRFILTTAHCFRQEENWVALIGTLPQEKYSALLEKWILHPNYVITVDATYNDVALTVTEKFMDFEKYNIKPLSITPIPPDILQFDLMCRMVGWEIREPQNFTLDVTSSDYNTQAQALATIVDMEKKFFSPKQCQSLVNLLPDVTLIADSSFMCVRHDDKFLTETQYGFIGSPLLCKEDIHDPDWMFMGMKLKEKNFENGMPELYVNIHRFGEYLNNTIKDPYGDPLRYFCHIKVCDRNYNVAGEYCLVGDVEDCFYRGYPRKHYFPIKSHGIKITRIPSAILCFHIYISLIVMK